jgi:hypothetical protein
LPIADFQCYFLVFVRLIIGAAFFHIISKHSAPISKVIEYLPRNIPRILINRTVVHPSTTASAEGDDHDDDNEKEFRENYVFDAYLLGFCDDVTRALARQLFKKPPNTDTDTDTTPTDNSKKKKQQRQRSRRTTKKNNGPQQHDSSYGGRLLTTVLKGEDEEYDAEDWSAAISVPPERVLLFPGAVASKDDTTSSELTYREIAHCDGCSKRIRGVIQKCVACFDYDLCQKCFPSLSKTHHKGKHSFNAEPAAA